MGNDILTVREKNKKAEEIHVVFPEFIRRRAVMIDCFIAFLFVLIIGGHYLPKPSLGMVDLVIVTVMISYSSTVCLDQYVGRFIRSVLCALISMLLLVGIFAIFAFAGILFLSASIQVLPKEMHGAALLNRITYRILRTIWSIFCFVLYMQFLVFVIGPTSTSSILPGFAALLLLVIGHVHLFRYLHLRLRAFLPVGDKEYWASYSKRHNGSGDISRHDH